MNNERILQDMSIMAALAKRLARSADVSKFDAGVDDPEAWALAHVLSEFEESFSNCLAILPRLIEADSSEINELLLDFGEGLRNIVFHLENSRYYAYLLPPGVEV
jgi:hypothetical protein